MKLDIWKDKREFIGSIEQQRMEKLADLGSKLRSHREEQTLSLEDVAAMTRIQRRQLQAIEEAQLAELPEPVYIQSFIKQYADALGLDGTELSSAFPTGATHRLSIRSSWRRWPMAQLRPIHLYLAYIVVIICAVSSLSNVLNRTELQATNKEAEQNPLTHSNSQDNRVRSKQFDKVKTNSATPTTDAMKNNKLVRVGVTLKAPSWLRVVADGKTEFEGVLPEGTQRTWIADEKLSVRAGNAGGVLVAFNQQEAKELGAPGAMREVTYSNSQN